MSDVFTRINLGRAFAQSQGERSPFYFDIIILFQDNKTAMPDWSRANPKEKQ